MVRRTKAGQAHQSAASFYLAAKQRRGIDERIARAYAGQADAMLKQVAELMASQVWRAK